MKIKKINQSKCAKKSMIERYAFNNNYPKETMNEGRFYENLNKNINCKMKLKLYQSLK